MSEIRLTTRLAKIAALVTPGARLADIGTDHAHLPLFLLESGVIHTAIACDIHQGPLEHAARNAAVHGYAKQISLRLGAGLAPVSSAECDVIAIAGMGGETIAEILSAAPWTRDGQHTLLLQPMTMAPRLRQYLAAQGYEICQETACQEGARHYVILRAIGGGIPKPLPLEECCFSRALLEDTGARGYLIALLRRETRVLDGMQRSAMTTAKILETQQRIVATIATALEGIK